MLEILVLLLLLEFFVYGEKLILVMKKSSVARFPVTMKEWKNLLMVLHIKDDSNWSEEGLVWRDKERPSWQELAKSPAVSALVVDNHPVVGVVGLKHKLMPTHLELVYLISMSVSLSFED